MYSNKYETDIYLHWHMTLIYKQYNITHPVVFPVSNYNCRSKRPSRVHAASRNFTLCPQGTYIHAYMHTWTLTESRRLWNKCINFKRVLTMSSTVIQ